MLRRVTHCIAEKKCFQSWTWVKCKCLAYIIAWMVLAPTVIVGFALFMGKAMALDDFDLAKYGPEDKVEVSRTDFIIKIVTYTNREELNKAFELATKDPMPDGAGVRGFTNVRADEDVCYVHVIPADLWDDREAMAIMGHEVYHCTLADHTDVLVATVDSTEDLYSADRELELEWLKKDYEDMGIEVD